MGADTAYFGAGEPEILISKFGDLGPCVEMSGLPSLSQSPRESAPGRTGIGLHAGKNLAHRPPVQGAGYFSGAEPTDSLPGLTFRGEMLACC